MPTYIALLRGINVSGQKQVKMDQLKELFHDLGFTDSRTYIQSGNVIFKSSSTSNAALCKKVKAGILKTFGFDVSVLVVTASDLKKVIKTNPFSKRKGIDTKRLHVTFLAGTPPSAGLKKLALVKSETDEWICSGDVVFLHTPGGYGKSKLSNNVLERALGLEATTRNWNTVNELYLLAKE